MGGGTIKKVPAYYRNIEILKLDHIEKFFKQKLHRIKFATKISVNADLYLSVEWS